MSYSAKVRLWLECGDDKIKLSHVGPSGIVPKQSHDATDGVLVIQVDERIRRDRVRLLDPIVERQVVRFESVTPDGQE